MKNKKEKYAKLSAMLLSASVALSSVGLGGCSEETPLEPSAAAASSMRFEAGEHIISVPIPIECDVRDSNVQYDYYPGYAPIGISITASYWSKFSGGSILYTNIEEVDCIPSSTDKDGNYLYVDFGTPVNANIENEITDDSDVKIFDVGEHIISVPIPITEDNRQDNYQYEYHNGYEAVGFGTTSTGHGYDFYNGGAILYKNVVPVECTHDANGYTSFGTPIENTKTRALN